MRVGIYCRVSSDHDENIKSLENQILSYINLVQGNPDWALQGIYTDRGISGTTTKHRMGFLRLLRHCEEGKIDLIVTKSISRFSRNTHDLLGVMRRLRHLQVDVIFEKEGIRMSEADNEFMLTLYAAVAQQEAVNISQNISWAYKKRAEQGKPFFRSLYGYRVVKVGKDQALTIIPEEAATIRQIFSEYNNGKKIAQIAKHLSHNNIPTRSGQANWNHTTIRSILTNEKYTGNTRVINRPSRLADLRTDQFAVNTEIYIANSHPAIIDQSSFSSAQERLSLEHLQNAATEKELNPLSGRTRCGHCGASYVIAFTKNGNRCLSCAEHRKNKSSCPAKPIWDTQLLDIIRSAYRARFQSDGHDALAELLESASTVDEMHQAENQRLTRMIDIARVGQALLAAPQNNSLIQQKKALETEFKRFENNLEQRERDFELRIKLAQKLDLYTSVTDALSHLNIDDLCALFPVIEIYSKTDARLLWHDQQTTQVGHCQPLLSAVRRSEQSTKEPETINPDRITLPANEKAVRAQTTLNINHALLAIKDGQPEKLRVCAYCRTSSPEERHISSLSRQVATYTHLIMTRPDYEFAGIYADHGKSGLRIHGRDAYQRMIADAKAGKFDMILTKSVARFGRNVVDVLETIRMLRSLPRPVIVCFENESIRTDANQCDFMLALHSALAQNEALSTSENVRWGIVNTLNQGTFQTPGSLPYGYRKSTDGHWEIDPQQAGIVRQIFQDYIRGMAPYTIAAKLSEKKVSTGRGHQHWGTANIHRMVRNEIYIGHYRYGKSYKPDFFSKRYRPNQGESNQYLIENHHQAIIDNATWHAAQAMTQSRSKRRSGTAHSNITSDEQSAWRRNFRHKLTCGLCGRNVVHCLNKYKGQPYYYWRCRASAQRNPDEHCHAPAIRQEQIEHAFMILLQQIKTDPVRQQQIRDYCTRLKRQLNNQSDLAALQTEQKTLYQKIHNAVLVEQSENIQLIDQITNYTEKVRKINARIDVFEQTKLSIENKIAFFTNFLSSIDEIPDFNPDFERIPFKPEWFDYLVDSGKIVNKSSIMFNLSFEDSQTITISGYFSHRLPFIG